MNKRCSLNRQCRTHTGRYVLAPSLNARERASCNNCFNAIKIRVWWHRHQVPNLQNHCAILADSGPTAHHATAWPCHHTCISQTVHRDTFAQHIFVQEVLVVATMAPYGHKDPQGPASARQSASPVPVDTVLKLLTGPDSKALAARHIAAIEALSRKNAAGFYMSDLEHVCSVIDVTIKAIKRGELQFVSALCLLLRCGFHGDIC